jgi:Fe-S cluster biosynthesis and repair protein YggX
MTAASEKEPTKITVKDGRGSTAFSYEGRPAEAMDAYHVWSERQIMSMQNEDRLRLGDIEASAVKLEGEARAERARLKALQEVMDHRKKVHDDTCKIDHKGHDKIGVSCVMCHWRGTMAEMTTTRECPQCGQRKLEAEAAQDLREVFAAIAHDAWAGWMKYLFEKCHTADAAPLCGKEVVIPAELVERWTRQLNTPYADLPENEKESDRKEADKYLGVL